MILGDEHPTKPELNTMADRVRTGMRPRLAATAGVVTWLLVRGIATPAAPEATAPILFWASSPAAPNETLLLLGGGLTQGTRIDIRPVADDAVEGETVEPGRWTACQAIQPTDNSLKVVIPRSFSPGVYAVRATAGDRSGEELLVNAADPWWLQGDEGPQATLGGWIRIFGVCLDLDGAAYVVLRGETGVERRLAPADQSRWELRADVPTDLTAGRYEVIVSNGHGGAAGRRSVGSIQVAPPVEWKRTVFEVAPKASGDGDEKAVIAALQKAARNGGGVVLLRRGVYDMRGPITIPPRTLLKGEDGDSVTLQWPDFETPPDTLITANDAGLEDLSIYCRRHATVIGSDQTSQRFRMQRVRVRANAFFMHVAPGKTHRGRAAPREVGEGRVVRVVGRNFQIVDCDLWGSGQVIVVNPHAFAGRQRPWYGLIAGNRIAYGYQGHLFENVDRLIFEANELVGHGSTAGGNGISTYWNNFSKNVFYARNHTHDIYGVDREALTLDGDGGAYFGTVAAAGDRLTLDGDPVFKDYAPTPHTDYRGGVVYVLEGTGAGQYRFVTGHRDREWVVDRPWDVPLDQTSVVSIVPFRGRSIFVENRIEDAGPLQLYGSAADVIVADNLTSRADGLLAWGLSQHGWGWHPVLRCQFLGNTVTGGSGYGARISGPASIVVSTTGNNDVYAGPLARAVVVRGNTLDDQAVITLDGTVTDPIVEGNSISGSPLGVRVGAAVTNAVVRNNAFTDVREPVSGEGAARVNAR
jgi:hypothetical protein